MTSQIPRRVSSRARFHPLEHWNNERLHYTFNGDATYVCNVGNDFRNLVDSRYITCAKGSAVSTKKEIPIKNPRKCSGNFNSKMNRKDTGVVLAPEMLEYRKQSKNIKKMKNKVTKENDRNRKVAGTLKQTEVKLVETDGKQKVAMQLKESVPPDIQPDGVISPKNAETEFFSNIQDKPKHVFKLGKTTNEEESHMPTSTIKTLRVNSINRKLRPLRGLSAQKICEAVSEENVKATSCKPSEIKNETLKGNSKLSTADHSFPLPQEVEMSIKDCVDEDKNRNRRNGTIPGNEKAEKPGLVDENGLRRSRRVRMRPLEFWNFEKAHVKTEEQGEVVVSYVKVIPYTPEDWRLIKRPIHPTEKRKRSSGHQKPVQRKKIKLFNVNANSLDLSNEENQTSKHPVKRSLDFSDYIEVVEFRDINFQTVEDEDRNVMCKLGVALPPKEDGVYTGFIVIQSHIVWVTSKDTTLFVTSGSGILRQLDLISGKGRVVDLGDRSSICINAGCKISVEKSASCLELVCLIILEERSNCTSSHSNDFYN